MVDRSAVRTHRGLPVFDNRRQAQRIAFGGSATVATARGAVEAEIQDLSYAGIRVRVRAESLGFASSSQLASTAKNVQATLGARFDVSLHESELGSLVQRRVDLTRISIPSNAPESIDLGCRFETPLTIEETEVLGAELPPQRARFHPNAGGPKARTPLSDWDDLPFNERWIRFAPNKFRAYVNARVSLDPALACDTKSVSPDALRVWCRRDGNRFALGESHNILNAAVLFSERYGDYVELRVTQGADEVWNGVACVRGVEINPDKPSVMLLTLGFGRALDREERTRFGLTG